MVRGRGLIVQQGQRVRFGETISTSMRPSLSMSPTASPRPEPEDLPGRPGPVRDVDELARAVAEKKLGGHGVGDRGAVVVDVAVGLDQVEPAVVVGVERGQPEAEHEPGRRGEAGRG